MTVPNVSEGRDLATLEAIGRAFAPAHFLDLHTDPDHDRAVFSLAARQGDMAQALIGGARSAIARIDISAHTGIHPHVGALDVMPVVYLDEERRGAAIAEVLTAAGFIGEDLGVPVFLYGELAGGRTRAELRNGGPERLAARVASRELAPDFGPLHVDPQAGATLVAARRPLIAFNLVLAPPVSLETARAIAARIRESGSDGLPGVRALGLHLERQDLIQVSTNIEDHRSVRARDVLAAVERHHPVARAELVAPAPEAALAGWPPAVRLDMPPTIEALLDR